MWPLHFLIGLCCLAFINGACLPPDLRFDCHPESGPNQQNCEARGCCWDSSKAPQPNVPTCSYPENYGGYETVNVTDTSSGVLAFMRRTFASPYPGDVPLLRVDCEHLTDYILRVKISDAEKQRYEPKYPIISRPNTTSKDPKYSLTFGAQSGFKVSRRQGGDIFNSLGVGALTFADQFLEISTLLSNQKLYGIGEHRTNLSLKLEWKRYTLFNHENGPQEDVNLYGSHPFYLASDPETGLSHGVFLHNSNAMDVLLSPQPSLTFRTVGGILDFYFFLGPSPDEVIQQYTSIIGRTLLPPYWGLGFHLCRYGYDSAARTREVWERNRALEIPYDVQWNDIDYMITANDFTLDPNRYGDLPALVDDIHDAGMKYIIILDPGVSAAEPPGTYPPFDLGVEQDVLVKHKNGSVFVGKAWNPVSTAWPDFTHPGAQAYWDQLLTDFHDLVPFDGIWLDMNEPDDFIDGTDDGCPQDELEVIPYTPGVIGDKLSFRTICMNAQQAAGTHYDVHNLYSISQCHVTNQGLRNLGKRPFVITRSTFSGVGKYSGHWSGDDVANWYDLQKSIQELLTFNMYGVSLMGIDICGFRGDTNQALCNRWTQLGAFYTFCRNHNDLGPIDQDPAVWDNVTIASIKKSLNTRYTLLPYLYTLFYESHVYGSTIARPLFFLYPNDPRAYEVELAFLWGSGLYIIPVLEEGAEAVETYLPAGRWFDWYTGEERMSSGETVVLDAPYDTIPLLLKAGNVIPTQAPAVTTTLSRKKGITLIVVPELTGFATGSLYWDDGEVIDPIENDQYGLVIFTAAANKFESAAVHWTTNDVPNVEAIKILGVKDRVATVTVEGQTLVSYVQDGSTLLIEGFTIPANETIRVQWS